MISKNKDINNHQLYVNILITHKNSRNTLNQMTLLVSSFVSLVKKNC